MAGNPTAKTSMSGPFAVAQHEKDVSEDQTRLGLGFLLLSVLVSVLPVITPIGGLMAFVAAIFLVLGRESFGEKHSKSVGAATAVLVLGESFVFVSSIWYLLFVLSLPNAVGYCSLTSWGLCDNALTGALVPHLSLLLAMEAVGAILTSLAFALFSYFLQRPKWRILLLLTFATSLATNVLVFSLLNSDLNSPLVPGWPSILETYRSGFNPDVARAFVDQVFMVSLLNLPPAAIYAAAYYTVYSRLGRGQLT